MSNRDQAIAELRQTPTTLREMTSSASDAALDYHPTPEAWSTREVLAHLVDDEMFVMRTRLERMIKEDRPQLAPHDEQRWYAHRNTARDDRTTLLDDFETQRAASLGIFALLRETEWSRTGIQPEYGEFTAADWLERWREHDQIHIEQIARTLAMYREQD
ncbi:MAG TPA: DinB family protein [Ktedonobacterales bacterium]|jgi:hypothetical protein|nr:DinB family protein [Ktedonobacterales bacterium]